MSHMGILELADRHISHVLSKGGNTQNQFHGKSGTGTSKFTLCGINVRDTSYRHLHYQNSLYDHEISSIISGS